MVSTNNEQNRLTYGVDYKDMTLSVDMDGVVMSGTIVLTASLHT